MGIESWGGIRRVSALSRGREGCKRWSWCGTEQRCGERLGLLDDSEAETMDSDEPRNSRHPAGGHGSTNPSLKLGVEGWRWYYSVGAKA